MRRPSGKKTLQPEAAADANSAHGAAIALLARRDYSTAEVSRKLADRGYTREAIAQAIAALGDSNSLNDQRYGQNVVAYRARRGQGPARIRNELRRSGLSNEAIDAAVKNNEDAPDFVKLARDARIRKFGAAIPKDRKERAKQARFLQYRGFSTDHIRAVLEGVPDDESDLDPAGEPDPT